MIRFEGRITGAAEKQFWKHSGTIGMKLFAFASLLVLTPIIAYGIRAQNWLMAGLCFGVLLLIPLMPFLPKDKSLIPKRIVIDDGFITSQSEKAGETKPITDVKTVYDYGEFYMLIFPFGNVSSSFICQKDLLTQGTLEDFEDLFKGKIVVVDKK